MKLLRIGQEFTVAFVGRALLPVAVLTGKSARPTTLIDWATLNVLCAAWRHPAGALLATLVVMPPLNGVEETGNNANIPGSAALAQSPRSSTGRFHDARWGVMTHYLGAAPSTAGGAELTAEQWNQQVDAFDVPIQKSGQTLPVRPAASRHRTGNELTRKHRS